MMLSISATNGLKSVIIFIKEIKCFRHCFLYPRTVCIIRNRDILLSSSNAGVGKVP